MPEPNRLLRTARESTPSRRVPGKYMSREELAEAVALWAAEHDDKHRSVAFDANHLGKLERGTVRCPRQPYINALCAVLDATPAELGFTARASEDDHPNLSVATSNGLYMADWQDDLLGFGEEHEALELARRVAASDVSTETLSRLEGIVDELAIRYPKTPPRELLSGRHRKFVGG